MTNLERFRYYHDSLESPDIFINWTFYLTVAAALQRRVCLFGKPNDPRVTSHIYPNMFAVFIAEPGIGKTAAADDCIGIFRSLAQNKVASNGEMELIEVIKTGPSSITVQQLYRYLALNYTTTDLSQIKPEPLAKGKVYIHSSLAFFCCEELGNLLDTDSGGLVGFLTEAWACKDFERQTKTQGIDIIKRLCMTLLGAATPQWMREASANKILQQGFSARALFLYADKKRKLTYRYSFNKDQIAARELLCKHIKELTTVFGEVTFSPEAEEFCKTWYESGGASPINKDKRLADYYGRKKLHLYKLAMTVHFADKLDLVITVDEVKTALQMLTEAEVSMHKALSFGGENPIYAIAQEALKFFDAVPPGTKLAFKQFHVNLFDMGPLEDIQACMQYLLDTDQIKATQGMKGLLYEKIQKSD